MKKLIALYLILLPLWAFAQQTFVPVSATMTDAEGSYTSKNFDAPNLQFWDNQSSITVKWGGDRLSLQKVGSANDTYSTTVSTNGMSLTVSAYRSSNSGKIYLIMVKRKSREGSVTINFKEKKYTYQ